MRYILNLLIVLTSLTSTLAMAHQSKASITKVLFNQRTQQVEIMHRFNLHDAEHAMQALFKKGADLYKSKETQNAFSQYVTERFAVFTEQGKVDLNYVGHEVEGKFFWIYQETDALNDVSQLHVKHSALRELWDTQVNTINFEGKGDLKTLTFDGLEEMMTVKFDSHH